MIKESGKFKWIDKGDGEKPIILLHGLMGGADNFGEMVDFISEEYHVYGLDLKLFEGNILKVSDMLVQAYKTSDFDLIPRLVSCRHSQHQNIHPS